jgi:predicted SAM-dependent methyltransferase
MTATALQQRLLQPLRALRRAARHRRSLRELGALMQRQPQRIIVGAAATGMEGWVATDRDCIDLLDARSWLRHMSEGALDAVFAEHVWEHLTEAQGRKAARVCARFLRPGGYLRVAVPDGHHPDADYIRQVRPGGTGDGADDHRVLYTADSFAALFQEAGLKVRLYEYFDADGRFHFEPFDPALGVVRRSRRYDPRNSGERLGYTSVVLDAVKP